MGSHFHQGGVIYALGRNDWGSHFPGGVIRDFDTGMPLKSTFVITFLPGGGGGVDLQE